MQTEYAAISAVLKEPKIMGRASLEPSDFSDHSCKMIWSAIQEVSRNSPIDIITLSEHLQKTTGQDWVRVIGAIANSPGTPSNIESYCEKVRKESLQRRAREICTRAVHGDGDVDIREITSALMALTRDRASRTVSLSETLTAAYRDIEAAVNKQGIPGLPTGFECMDKNLGGFHNSDLVVIAGRPAMGKTAFLLSLMIKCQARSYFVSGEMAHQQVGGRLISQQSRVSASKLRNGSLTESDWPYITSAFESLLNRQCWIYDKPNPSIQDVMQNARMAKHEHDIEILYVDYIQKIKSPGKNSRVDEIEDVVMGLKDIGRELNIPVVALAQVNRECEKRPDKRPIMSDLKGAGGIEQEADAVAFLYRDHVYNPGSDETDAELLWEKNRHGPNGMMKIHWCPRTMTFSDVGQAYNY